MEFSSEKQSNILNYCLKLEYFENNQVSNQF